GFAGLLVLGSLRDSAVHGDMAAHAKLASQSLTESQKQLDSADPTLKSIVALSDTNALRTAKSDIARALVSSHSLNATALDALNRIQQTDHAMTQGFDASVTVAVSHALALSELARDGNRRLFALGPKTGSAEWKATAEEYRGTLRAQLVVLDSAAK